eukprot:UN28737
MYVYSFVPGESVNIRWSYDEIQDCIKSNLPPPKCQKCALYGECGTNDARICDGNPEVQCYEEWSQTMTRHSTENFNDQIVGDIAAQILNAYEIDDTTLVNRYQYFLPVTLSFTKESITQGDIFSVLNAMSRVLLIEPRYIELNIGTNGDHIHVFLYSQDIETTDRYLSHRDTLIDELQPYLTQEGLELDLA